MKKHITLLILLFSSSFALSQVGIGTTSPDNSAALDITSTTKGLLTPRLTEVQRLAIVSPSTGLLIYQTNNTTGYWYYNGTTWTNFASGNCWSLTGNVGTNPSINKLGTTDAQPFIVKTNNSENLRIESTGNIGIGTTNPTNNFTLTSPNAYKFYENFESSTVGNITSNNANNIYMFNANIGDCYVMDS